MALVCAADVGTRAARAAVYDAAGRLLGRASREIDLHRPSALEGRYSSSDVWRAVGEALRAAMGAAGAAPEHVAGLAFDATCSLVLMGAPEPWDVVAWFDRSALDEARICGAPSPEFQAPKLLRIKRRDPALWARISAVFDLCDFLVWRATGAAGRGRSALAAKWPWSPRAGWDEALLHRAGLEDLPGKAGGTERAAPVGAMAGRLTPEAAAALGLAPGTPVAAGMIDAFAAALGLGPLEPGEAALTAGTSSCLMVFSHTRPQGGACVWGPFEGAGWPEFWAMEAGESASGALLDHLLEAFGGLAPSPEAHARLGAEIMAARAAEGEDYGRGLEVLPEFHGRRAPLEAAARRGAIIGLTMEPGPEALRKLYWRACVAIALDMAEAARALESAGAGPIRRLRMGGGQARHPLMPQLYADALNREIWAPEADEDAALRGGAMNAATAAGLYADLGAAARAMAPRLRPIIPDPAGVAARAADGRRLARLRALLLEDLS